MNLTEGRAVGDGGGVNTQLCIPNTGRRQISLLDPSLISACFDFTADLMVGGGGGVVL